MPDFSCHFVAVIFIFFISCKANPQGKEHEMLSEPGASADLRDKESLLCTTWKHAFEEDTKDLTIYKSTDQSFPPARFRRKLTLNVDNTCSGNTLQRNDAHTLASGTWSWVNDSTIAIALGTAQTDTLVIRHLSPGLLKAKK